jgi:hypothetical protein
MTRSMAITAIALALMVQTAQAGEQRGGDAALGALSGAVVFGPVGAVAGAVVGYTAGPSIARSWGFRRSRTAGQTRGPAREARAEIPLPAPRAASAPPRVTAQPPATAQGPVAPPVQTLE